MSGISYFFQKTYQKRTSDINLGDMDSIKKRTLLSSKTYHPANWQTIEILSRNSVLNQIYCTSNPEESVSGYSILLPLNYFIVSYAIYSAIWYQITAIYLIHLTSLRRFKNFWGQIWVSIIYIRLSPLQ